MESFFAVLKTEMLSLQHFTHIDHFRSQHNPFLY